MSSMFQQGDRAKAIEFPSAVYSMHPFDQVLVKDELVGFSTWIGYSSNEGAMLTLAMLDEQHAVPGTEVELLWGEPNGGSRASNPMRQPAADPYTRPSRIHKKKAGPCFPTS
jgi:vanillate/3-O-methylgallate O-demethylase